MKISTVLDKIDDGAIALPEFQGGYVWSRAQVRGLMNSLYRRYPVGGLLTWLTKTETVAAKGDGLLQPGYVSLLLDGQQRMTSLHGIARGAPPPFHRSPLPDPPRPTPRRPPRRPSAAHRGCLVKLVKLSIQRYRSIIATEKFTLSDFTVLVGPNNEGKSKILQALVTSMNALAGMTKPRSAS